MKRKYQLYGKNRKVFLDGLQRYQDRGVIIRVDGKEAKASEWMKILEVQADGSFYMGDYIIEDVIKPPENDLKEKGQKMDGVGDEDSKEEAEVVLQKAEMVCEEINIYGIKKEDPAASAEEGGNVTTCSEQYPIGALKEIRFDRVYNR